MFSSYFRGHDPSGKHNKAKSKAFGNKYYFDYDPNRPGSNFPRSYVSLWHHFRAHFSIISGVVFKHSKMQKVGIPLALPARLPRTHHRRGGNQEAPSGTQEAPRRHPGGTHLRFSPLVQAMFGIIFCIKHYINRFSGINFYTFSTQK